MKNGLNEEEVWPNELPGLQSSRDRKGGKKGDDLEPLRKKGAAAMPKVCQLLVALAPMAQTAPGQSRGHPWTLPKEKRGKAAS